MGVAQAGLCEKEQGRPRVQIQAPSRHLGWDLHWFGASIRLADSPLRFFSGFQLPLAPRLQAHVPPPAPSSFRPHLPSSLSDRLTLQLDDVAKFIPSP